MPTKCHQSNTVALPISLENNSTLSGTAAIMEQFGKEFNLPTASNVEGIPFDSISKTFCLQQARELCEFMMVNIHKEGKKRFESLLSETDGQTDCDIECNLEDNKNNSDTNEDDDEVNSDSEDDSACQSSYHSGNASHLIPETTLTMVENVFEKEDQQFLSTYDSLKCSIQNAIQSDTMETLIKELSENKNIREVRDHLGRSLLHRAAQEGDTDIVECLFSIGFNPNIKEKCGVTPLIIAVISKNKEICDILVKNKASVRGPLFSDVPSPMDIARKMELTEIYELFNTSQSDDEDVDISKYDTSYNIVANATKETSTEVTILNRSTPGFITGVVGDVETCKTNRGVMSRSSGYEWIGIIPGDMHTKGYLAEACFKEQGQGGFHYLVNKVLKRPKLIVSAFKKKKFEQGNLDRIKEAVRDGSRAYGLAAVMEFEKSDFYPSEQQLSLCLRSNGNHNEVLLKQFKLWLAHFESIDPSFKYRIRLFMLYGPLFELFELSTCNCWGEARELCYILQLPLYAHLNFRNYYTECFVHTVNLLSKWPLAFRKLLSNNCSINLSGKSGNGIELDAFVEAELVQPLKTYVSGNVY